MVRKSLRNAITFVCIRPFHSSAEVLRREVVFSVECDADADVVIVRAEHIRAVAGALHPPVDHLTGDERRPIQDDRARTVELLDITDGDFVDVLREAVVSDRVRRAIPMRLRPASLILAVPIGVGVVLIRGHVDAVIAGDDVEVRVADERGNPCHRTLGVHLLEDQLLDLERLIRRPRRCRVDRGEHSKGAGEVDEADDHDEAEHADGADEAGDLVDDPAGTGCRRSVGDVLSLVRQWVCRRVGAVDPSVAGLPGGMGRGIVRPPAPAHTMSNCVEGDRYSDPSLRIICNRWTIRRGNISEKL